MISGIFESIERLIEYIPVDTDSPTNGRFGIGTTIDSRNYFEDIDGVAIRLGVLEVGDKTVSFRDIIKLFNKFLTDATIENSTYNYCTILYHQSVQDIRHSTDQSQKVEWFFSYNQFWIFQI